MVPHRNAIARSLATVAGALLFAVGLTGTAAAQRYYSAELSLSGNNVVPPNSSGAYGYGTVSIDTETNRLHYDITLIALAGEIESHIHGFAAPGHNAPVIVEIPTGDHKVDDWNYADEQEPDILAGLSYVVVHTFDFPGGELRGQIVPAPLATGVAPETKTVALTLAPPMPNPASGPVDIGFSLTHPAVARVSVIDARGRRVIHLLDGALTAGPHTVRWSGVDASGRFVAAGLYWACLESEGIRRVRKLAILH